MKLTLLAFTALLTLPLGSGCTPKLQTETPLYDLFMNAELDGKLVTTTGFVHLNTGIAASTTCKGSECTLELWFTEDTANMGEFNSLTLYVQTGSGENEMAELPSKYARTDLKIKAVGGKVLTHGDLAKVTGKAKCKLGGKASLPCSIRVERFDAR
jgi:hypothetical protein